MKKFLGIKLLSLILAGVVAVGSIGAGGYVIYGYESLPREVAEARVIDPGPEPEEPEELPEEEEAEEVQVEEEKELSMAYTSIEKDLKIKIEDQDSRLVTGEQFSVNVKADKKNAKPSVYEDKDKDGIIYISKIDAGNYTVTLENVGAYVVKNGSMQVTVKDKIEYKKVDVKDEIKTESQINVAAEDTALNNVPQESSLQDTVPLLESKVTTTKVSRADVDLENFSKASVSSKTVSTVLTKQESTVPDPEPEEELNDTDTSAVENSLTATVSVPQSATLYDSGNEASTSLELALGISGDDTLITAVSWSSSDTDVVTLSGESGYSVTLSAEETGSAEVTATITYTADEEGTTAEASVKTSVTVAEFSDSSVVLKDKSGNILYVDADAQKQATLKDYDSVDTFYTSPKYTGWRTDGGKVYYYDADHNKVTGNQVIGGVMYTFGGDGALSQSSGNRGIDVSKYQGTIDWGAVAASGINFAIIRVGYRGSSTGALVEDPYFKKNISGATQAGIKVGIYFFTQAVNEAEAVEEASMAMSLASKYKMTYPIFIDTESASNGRANGLSKSARTAVVKAFCQTVRNGGYKAGVYASKSWYANQLDASALSGYCIWVAQYSSGCTYSGKYDMWQYSSKGSVSGIKGNVDMNISYTGY